MCGKNTSSQKIKILKNELNIANERIIQLEMVRIAAYLLLEDPTSQSYQLMLRSIIQRTKPD